MNCINTNTLISICTCAIILTQFLFWRYIARQKAYEEEKGKNLATKEDIGVITDKIEAIKDNYNRSLESHKIELQKEFEFQKYVMQLCQALDNKLLNLVAECLKAHVSEGISYPQSDNKLISANSALNKFMLTYEKRYKTDSTISKLIKISTKIQIDNELGNLIYEQYNNEIYERIEDADKKKLLHALELSLLLFLPPFNKEKESVQ